MRRLLPLILALLPGSLAADPITGRTWELLAIDGVVFDAPATLVFGADGTVSGKAPCNGWSVGNGATLPALALTGIRATRMACDKLDLETRFFAVLAEMTEARLAGTQNLILTGPEGGRMEFVPEVMNSLTRCLTCPPED